MQRPISRRTLLRYAAALSTASVSGFAPHAYGQATARSLFKSGALPVIGMGTWLTFNVGSDVPLLDARTALLREFFDLGGRLIDCAPMYGSSADALGYALRNIKAADKLIAAEKVWRAAGGSVREQIDTQARRWGVKRFHLVQVHNLSQWQKYLPALRELKADGHIDAIGITTSHGRRHQDVEDILRTQEIDVLQLTYNITHREVEHQLLPLAAEQGVAVIANRPFAGGRLIKRLKRASTLPTWAADLGVRSWAEFLLGFIVSHPAVVCAIPATTRIAHLRENMRANSLPDIGPAERMKMARYVATA